MEVNKPPAFDRSEKNRVKRVPARGSYDRQEVFEIIDAAPIGHVGIASATGGVTVIPMVHARMEDCLIFHGAKSSRLIKHLGGGEPVCVSFALVDGFVLAKSLFHHSMNYRSVVAFGRGEPIVDGKEITQALKAISDKIMPHRWQHARLPNKKEIAATAVIRVPIETASAKIRTGDPIDDAEDASLPVWSGVLPVQTKMVAAIPDQNSKDIGLPDYIERFRDLYNANT